MSMTLKRTAVAVTWILASLICLLLIGAAEAGVQPSEQTPEPAMLHQRAPAAEAQVADVDRFMPRDTAPTRTLRCWQEGLLIVERSVRSPAEPEPRSVELSDPEQRPMQLHDLRNALCLIE
jgi:hypothetical protein